MTFDRVLCVDDSHRPNEIPASRWLKKGQVYTVEKVGKDFAGVYFYFLQELEGTPPYLGFNVNRFLPVVEAPDQALADEQVLEEELELA